MTNKRKGFDPVIMQFIVQLSILYTQIIGGKYLKCKNKNSKTFGYEIGVTNCDEYLIKNSPSLIEGWKHSN